MKVNIAPLVIFGMGMAITLDLIKLDYGWATFHILTVLPLLIIKTFYE